MPKLPTFQAEGSITQLAGTTSNVQVPLTQTLGTALKPVTDFVVKQKVQEKLPDYMLPSSFVEIDTFPLTINGKLICSDKSLTNCLM